MLRECLIAASDKLTDDDIHLLSRLGHTYCQASPPMFWFSEERSKGSSDPELTMVNDAVALIKLICQCGFDADDFVTWRYAKADEKSHKKLWRKTLAGAGLTSQSELRSGRSNNAKCLGVSLRAGNVKRTVLLSVWLLALKHGGGLPEGLQRFTG